MTDQQVDALVARSTAGEGVEAILVDLGLDSDISIAEIRAHPTAGTRLLNAKVQQRAAIAARKQQIK